MGIWVKHNSLSSPLKNKHTTKVWLLIKQLCFNMLISPMDGDDARGINKHSKHKASVLHKKPLTRLNHRHSQATAFQFVFVPPAGN